MECDAVHYAVLADALRSALSLLYSLVACLLFSAVFVHVPSDDYFVHQRTEFAANLSKYWREMTTGTPVELPAGASMSATAALAFAIVAVAVVALCTCMLAVLLACRCVYMLQFYAMSCLTIINTAVALYFTWSVSMWCNVALDWPTSAIIATNYAGVALFCVFATVPSPTLYKCIVVMNTAMYAVLMARHLPAAVVWSVLAVMSLWDVFTVLSPCGPLRSAIDSTDELGDERLERLSQAIALTAGQMHRRRVHSGSGSGSDCGSDSADSEPIRMGLGDFIFCSLAVAECSIGATGVQSVAALALTIIVGLMATLAAVVGLDATLPALPLPIAAGAIVRFASPHLLQPFADAVADNVVYV